MGTVSLEPMSDAEVGEFMAVIFPTYVAERATADRVSLAEAERFARDQHTRLLPDGPKTPGHHFLRISEVPSGDWLGGIWVHTDIEAKSAFLYNITVFTQFRRRGFGREALVSLQNRLRALGCACVALNVFATNEAALDLYTSLGFNAVSSHMNKAL